MRDLKYSEILKLNGLLAESLKEEDSYKVTVLSNITINSLNEILEYSIRERNINAKVTIGNYDNILQDSKKYSDTNLIIIFWEACNILDGLHYKANTMNEEEISAVIEKVKSEIDFVFMNLKDTSLVICNKFSSLLFNNELIKSNNFDKICKELNDHLTAKNNSNCVLIDIDKIIATVSIEKTVDFRYYYSSKALYKIDFFKAYSTFINPIIRTVKGKSKKVLIFDCDNTLWRGVIGEDGNDKIKMSSKTKEGVIFEEIQYIGLELNKRGVLLGLCSKNNLADVEAVLDSHADMILKKQNISAQKVNWDDKISNLRRIAKDLNLGLDSFIFIDDSDFEIELVKNNLPEIDVLKVPSNLYEYPQLLRKLAQSFYSISETKEDASRIRMYQQQMEREKEKTVFGNIENYLESLDLSITIYVDEKDMIPRIAQMTQKTNQFNLTTKRYAETDISNFVQREEYSVIAFEVKDKYGDSGITGLSILNFLNDGKEACIDVLLISCRIIGRNIEFAFFNSLVTFLQHKGVKKVKAVYIKTPKNDQVSDFYESLGFVSKNISAEKKEYELELSNYISKNINYIKINYDRKD